MGMSSASWKLLVASSIATGVAFFLHLISFGTREWLVATDNSPFRSIGFHEACFRQCRRPYCPTGNYEVMYDGCWKIYDYYFHEIRTWLMPAWFEQIRDAGISLVLLLLLCLVLSIVCCVLLFRSRDTTDYDANRRLLEVCLLASTFILLLISGVGGVVIVAIFSVHAFDEAWMPISDMNRFGYSFWLQVCSSALVICSCLASLLAGIFKVLKKNSLQQRSYSEDFHLGRRY